MTRENGKPTFFETCSSEEQAALHAMHALLLEKDELLGGEEHPTSMPYFYHIRPVVSAARLEALGQHTNLEHAQNKLDQIYAGLKHLLRTNEHRQNPNFTGKTQFLKEEEIELITSITGVFEEMGMISFVPRGDWDGVIEGEWISSNL